MALRDNDELSRKALLHAEAEHDQQSYLESRLIEQKRLTAVKNAAGEARKSLALAQVAATLLSGLPDVLRRPEKHDREKTGAHSLRVQRHQDSVALNAIEMAAALIDSADFYLNQDIAEEIEERPLKGRIVRPNFPRRT